MLYRTRGPSSPISSRLSASRLSCGSTRPACFVSVASRRLTVAAAVAATSATFLAFCGPTSSAAVPKHRYALCSTLASKAQLRVEFCGKPAQGYTPIYTDNPSGNTASVNAGDYNLYVGGGAINLGFAKALGLRGANAYQTLHEAMLKHAAASRGRLAPLVRADDDTLADGSGMQTMLSSLGLLGCFARVPADGAPDRGPVGAAFLDVFEARARPLSSKNIAMLYVVGPKGEGAAGGHGATIPGREDFLQAVEDMAVNALMVVAEYNEAVLAKRLGARLEKVEFVQFCLVSGGVYMHPECQKLDVAKAIVRGLGVAANRTHAAPVVRFAYDSSSFEEAVNAEISFASSS